MQSVIHLIIHITFISAHFWNRWLPVLRHPYVSKGVLLWAHHEKIVCVDQTYAFVGGLDLCYGRWDDYQHRLTDLGEKEERIKVKRHMSTLPKYFTGESSSIRTSSLPDITPEVAEEVEEEQSDTEIPSETEQLLTETTFMVRDIDMVDSFEDKENFDQITLSRQNIEGRRFKEAFRKVQATRLFEGLGIPKSKSLAELSPTKTDTKKGMFPVQPADHHRTVKEMALVHLGLERKFRLWHGKDYVNFINKDFEDLEQPYSDMIDRNTTPRMPWHDVGLYVQGMAARDIARHFILRWNHAKGEICPKDHSKPYLMPKCYSNLENVPSILQETVGSIYRAECQVLRSLCFWSGHIIETENSIHKAYLSVIREAKKFIYIENQFFISQPNGSGCVFNKIADALFNRILKAHRERKEFRVYVILPLLPAFEGEVGTGTGTLIQAITHWNYKSICRGSNSLKSRLEMHMKEPSKYIGFYGLRTHGILNGKPVTELVYVHSKLLLADDRVAIIGSANINDRSMLGRRDSEIAVIIRDTNFLDEPQGAGQFCYSLRTSLFKEHLGLMQQLDSEIDLRYPNKREFYSKVWDEIAINNTKIYEEVFCCLPSDKVTKFDDLRKYQSIPKLASTDEEAAKKKLERVRGYLVKFPTLFLCDERLEPHLTTKEHYLPSSVFT